MIQHSFFTLIRSNALWLSDIRKKNKNKKSEYVGNTVFWWSKSTKLQSNSSLQGLFSFCVTLPLFVPYSHTVGLFISCMDFFTDFFAYYLFINNKLKHSFKWFVQIHWFIQEWNTWLSFRMSHWISYSVNPFKILINSGTKQANVLYVSKWITQLICSNTMQ